MSYEPFVREVLNCALHRVPTEAQRILRWGSVQSKAISLVQREMTQVAFGAPVVHAVAPSSC